MTELPILYKRNTNGTIQQWQIFVENGSFSTRAGRVYGKIRTSDPTFCERKNAGKANETTAHEQALTEAKSKWDKQIKKGYTEDISKVDEAANRFYSPMLAHKYLEHKDWLKFPCWCQRKSDGIRCILTKDGAFSREGNKHLTVPHIEAIFKPVFKVYPNAIFDGELYNHSLHSGGITEQEVDNGIIEVDNEGFEKLCSLIKKTKPTIKDLFESEDIVQYHVYDCPRIDTLTEQDVFWTRYQKMVKVLTTEFNLVATGKVFVVNTYPLTSHEEVITLHNKFVDEEGYEGIIIRTDGPYEGKRTKYLLKYKIFDDAEFILLDILPGKGNKSSWASRAIFRADNGKLFRAGIIGKEPYCKKLLLEKEDVIGKKATVKYFRLTKGGIPRFPKMWSIRDYE